MSSQLFHCFHLLWIYSDSFVGYNVTRESNGWQLEVTFIKLREWLAILESLHNNFQITCIFFLTPGVHEDIINEDDNEQVQVFFEYSVHQIHESYMRNGYSKWHKLIMTIQSSEGCFRNVTISDPKVMMTRSEVYHCEMSSTLKLVKQVINHGDGILIIDYDLVQLSIVNTHYERTIFLPYE